MERITRAKIKYLKGLQEKKSRKESGCFLAEGLKMVQEGLKAGWNCTLIVFSGEALPEEIRGIPPATQVLRCSEAELRECSSLQNPDRVLGVFEFQPERELSENEDSLLLDGIHDPGNLGTLIRTADWFGIRQLLLSEDCVDAYNPKCLRASMGSVFRVRTVYLNDLKDFILQHATEVWIADMEGKSPSVMKSHPRKYLLLGSESQGVSPAIQSLPGTEKISIPGQGAESLNVGIAGGILMAVWKGKF